jgi:hypothetical protein
MFLYFVSFTFSLNQSHNSFFFNYKEGLSPKKKTTRTVVTTHYCFASTFLSGEIFLKIEFNAKKGKTGMVCEKALIFVKFKIKLYSLDLMAFSSCLR